MSVASAVEQSNEPDDEPLVEPLAAPIEGAPHKYLIAFAVVLAALMQVIDSSIVNVALPDMMGNLGASLDEIAWVSTGYILASVIIIPLTGWLGEFFGRKRYFVGSIILFTIASFLCGASHSLWALVFWRIVQGLGGGALMTVSQAVLFESFPRKEAGTAMALFGLGVMVGPTIGPTLRRLAHRQLRLALDLLRQSSGRRSRGGDDHRIRARSGVPASSALGGLHGNRAARGERRLSAVPARAGTARGLVRLALDDHARRHRNRDGCLARVARDDRRSSGDRLPRPAAPADVGRNTPRGRHGSRPVRIGVHTSGLFSRAISG